MAGYKDEEIEGAVSRFVQSTLRIEKDALGPVDLSSKFNEVLQLISSTLVYDPNAIFYVIYLATNRLNVDVELAITYVDDISEAIDEMGYYTKTKDVSRTTLLGDAAAALLTVDQILTDKNAISSKAFTRYQQAVDEFTRVSLEPNIKQQSQIVRPPQQARSSVLTAVSDLSTAYGGILEVLEQVRQMLEEFNALNLGVISIQNSVQKVREDLKTLQGLFESTATTRDDKIALCRGAYLDIASGKSVLNNFTTVSDPADPRLISSASIVGRPEVAAGEGELLPATVTGTESGPWEIAAGANQLKVAEDGGVEQTYTFTPPAQPSVTSGYDENFDVNISTPVAYNIVAGVSDRLEIDGLPPILLTAGANRTAAQIASDITTWAGAGPYPYTAAAVNVGGLNFIKITKTTPGATEIRMTAEDATHQAKILAAYQATGFYEGQADTSTGVSAAEAAQEINDQGFITAEVVRTLHENGDQGVIGTTTYMTLPLNTIADLAHAGDMLVIREGLNAGYRRVVSVQRLLGFDRVTIESATPFKETGTTESWILLSEKLKLTSKATDLTTELVIGTGNANSVLGFSPSTVPGTTTGFRVAENGTDVDFLRLDVVEGDIVRIAGSDREVLELSTNYQLELDPPLNTDATITGFRILSAAAVAYESLDTALDSWYELLEASDFQEDILELERVINPLVANKNPSLALLQTARDKVAELRSLLTDTTPDGLTEVLKAFQVAIVPRIDAALKMLVERGMDRAYDLLMDGEIATFFAMDKDDASSSSFMLKSMRGVVQSDLPISKLDEDADDIIHDDLVEDTDADYDYSDEDEDENVKLLGEVPDLDEDDEALISNVRY
jgi:hypothetical protein